MNKKIAYLALALIYFFVFVQESIAGTVPQSNADPLLKRGHSHKKKCDVVVARAIFNDKIRGVITLTEEDDDSAFILGLFSKGLDNPTKNWYNILLKDCNSNVAYNLTKYIEFEDGGTQPFFIAADFNLQKFLGEDENGKLKCQTGPTVCVTSNDKIAASATQIGIILQSFINRTKEHDE
ncbi:3780_t:CDS:2 [Dentiscutata erythropus]|uniref:3780_t:CDS:1 n=1 Tax=Dentiscutata erythropus TaxID=1348616 RepID=A0A9N9NLD0_9GLOM|nr:3780_t:CDS:2 [Dentiscutata erythropus]